MKNILSKCALVIAICGSYLSSEAQELSSLTLIDAHENIEIGVLSEGDSIYIPDLNTDELTVRADVSGEVGSVLFELDGRIVGAQNSFPYAMFGMTDGIYNPWTPELKTYKITASIYSLPQGQGLLLDENSVTVTFFGEYGALPSGPRVSALVLINADTDEDIAEIKEGSVFILGEIGTNNLNIRAETNEETESVVFSYQDSTGYHTENLPEYAIGANDGDDYRPWNPDIGLNRVSATPFDKNKGQGNSGDSLTVEFAILEESPHNTAPPFELRINSGGETVVYNDTIYVADTLFIGEGKSFSNTRIADILETDNDTIYKTERTTTGGSRSFGYSIPVENGEYEVKLHFAEIYWGATGGGEGGGGKRVFSVSIENDTVIMDYDLSSATEAMTAIVKTFETAVADGELNIDFWATVDQPKVSALEIYGINAVVSPDFCDWKGLASPPSTQVRTNGVEINDKLYVFGGIPDSTTTPIMEVYDPETDIWSAAAALQGPLSGMATVGAGNEIWLLGGIGKDTTEFVSNSVRIYNTVNDTWRDGPLLPQARAAGTAVYNGGKIHFFGGLMPDGITETGDHYILNLNDSLPRWQVAAPLNEPRSHLGGTQLNGKIYTVGGRQLQDSILRSVPYFEEYDPVTDSWSKKMDLPMPLSHIASAIVNHNDKIIVVGGENGDSYLSRVAEYDPEMDNWSERCALPGEFINPLAAVFGNRMVVVNGEGDETVSIALEAEMEIPGEEEEDRIKVLVYHETGGFRHASIDAGIEMVREFGDELGWTVTASQTSEIFQTDSLATCDVVIWMNTTGDDLLTADEQLAFEGFIQSGGGFVGVHSATDTYRNGSWPWYNDLVGAIVQVNPYHTANNTNATLDIVGEHRAVAHLGVEWNKDEEYYYWERNGGYLYGGNIDLLQVRSTGPNSYDSPRPVTWFKEYDGGRSFYTALGHNASDYESNEEFRTMLKEAILWASEKEEVISYEPMEEEVLEPPVDESIELFPNPVVDMLTINTELLTEGVVGEVLIFGLDGNLVKQKAINVYDNQIDMGDLPAGYYIVAVRIGAVSERMLVYKQH